MLGCKMVGFPRIKDISMHTRINVPTPISFVFEKRAGKHVIVGEKKEEVSEDLIFLGKVMEHTPGRNYFNYNVWLDVDFPHIVLICGKRGTGKSYDLGVIMEGLASSEVTHISTRAQSTAILLVDTLGQFWLSKYPPIAEEEGGKEQLKLLDKWGLSPSSMQNIVVFVPRGCTKHFADWQDLTIKTSELQAEDWCGLFGMDMYSSRIGQLLHLTYRKVVDTGYTWVKRDPDSGMVFMRRQIEAKEDYTIDDLIECIEHDEQVTSKAIGFEVRTRRALLSRLLDVRNWKIFSEKGVDIKDFFKEGRVTFVNLQEVDYDLKALIVGILIRKIFRARMETCSKLRAVQGLLKEGEESGIRNKKALAKKLQDEATRTGIPSGWVLIDEAHNYCPEEELTAAKKELIRFAKEGRSLGLGLIMTTQQPSAISGKLSSQIDILISHGLAFSSDISAVVSRILNNPPSNIRIGTEEISSNVMTFLLRSLEEGEGIVSCDGVDRVFCIKIRPRVSMHGGGAIK